MKALGAEIRHDVTAINNLQAGLHSRADSGVAGLFVSRRRGARPGPLVLQDPVLPSGSSPDAAHDTPPDTPSDRADWIARHLAADCFHFARPGAGRR